MPNPAKDNVNKYAVVWSSYSWGEEPGIVQPFPAAICPVCSQAMLVVQQKLAQHMRPTDSDPMDDVLCAGGGKDATPTLSERHTGAWQLIVKATGRALGSYKTQEEAEERLRATVAATHSDGSARPRVRRFDLFDAGALKPAEKLANGWLRVSGRIARVGIQEYADAAGRVHRELREPTEVFDPAAMASFAQVPLTNTHPTKLLDATDARLHAVGSISAPVRDGDWLVADMLITDQDAVAAAEAGRNELSCGYEAELDETPGVHPVFGPYDARQLGIRGNHLALVDEARAGHEARLRLDGADARMVPSTQRVTHRKTEPSMQILINGQRFDLTDANGPQIQNAADALAKRLDDAAKAKAKADKIALKWALRHADADEAPDADEEEDAAVECPQCGGSGKMVKAGDDAAMIGCDMCDGKGTVPASSLGEFGGEEEDGADEEMSGEAKKDIDELEAEQETEKEAGKAHKDWKARRADRRARSRKDRAQKRKDGVGKFVAAIRRRVDHAVKARVALEVKAREVLGADADLAKLDDAAVMAKALEKLEPGVKFDAAEVPVAFKIACKRMDAEATSGADDARAAAASATAAGAPRVDGSPSRTRVLDAKEKFARRMQEIPFGRQKAAEHMAKK
jgi:hypothetical protein